MSSTSTPLSLHASAVLEYADPDSQGIDAACLERLYARIEAHIAAGWYPGATLAMARRGCLVASKHFGVSRLATDSAPPPCGA